MRFWARGLMLISLVLAGMLALAGSARAELPELIGTIRSDTTNALFGRRILPLGDQNGDGLGDFLVSNHSPSQMLYYGGDPLDTVYALRFDSVSYRTNNVGDLNGDGYDDFSGPARRDGRWKLAVFYGGPSIDTAIDLRFGDDSLFAGGYTVRTFDLNNNGTDELIAQEFIYQESVVFFELEAQPDSTPDLELTPPNMQGGFDYAAFGDGIISGDFNGDGRRDLGVSFRPKQIAAENASVYLYWGGPGFDTIPDLIIERPGDYVPSNEHFGTVLEILGDVDGDGYEDFYAGAPESSADNTGFIYFGGPGIDDVPDIVIADLPGPTRPAGDVNNDGYNDVIKGYPSDWSSSGWVKIYFGGPDIDSIPDLTIHNSDMPEYQRRFGYDCVGVGDVNGDGIDDFAFSAIAGNRGEVYLFAGWDGRTLIDYDYEPVIPMWYSLSGNYSDTSFSPFSPSLSTVFTVGLPVRSTVHLSIYNIVDQRIRTLVVWTLSAGTYHFSWDGNDESGKPVCSGIYFVRLSAGGFEQSEKIILLR